MNTLRRVKNQQIQQSPIAMKTPKKRSKPRPDKSQPLLRQLAAVPAKLFSGAFRQQYGAICFRYANDGAGIEILVITSRESARWVIPKGWPMKGKKPFEAAAIEAWEEAGVRGTVRKKPVGRYTYLKDLDDGDVAPCIVDLFQVEVVEITNDFKEQGQRILEWVSPDEAARRVREIELKSLLVEFEVRPRRKRDPR
ncbi:8-oxo-dGTP pyrophosphatase MutT (NUDIX family) [Rhizobium sp. BK456]|nr:8-oxo-dGTP pyrophosphatase MutT (NUDIX family) [Rhizobium sp. BK456]